MDGLINTCSTDYEINVAQGSVHAPNMYNIYTAGYPSTAANHYMYVGVRRWRKKGHPPLEIGTKNQSFLENPKSAA